MLHIGMFVRCVGILCLVLACVCWLDVCMGHGGVKSLVGRSEGAYQARGYILVWGVQCSALWDRPCRALHTFMGCAHGLFHAFITGLNYYTRSKVLRFNYVVDRGRV